MIHSFKKSERAIHFFCQKNEAFACTKTKEFPTLPYPLSLYSRIHCYPYPLYLYSRIHRYPYPHSLYSRIHRYPYPLSLQQNPPLSVYPLTLRIHRYPYTLSLSESPAIRVLYSGSKHRERVDWILFISSFYEESLKKIACYSQVTLQVRERVTGLTLHRGFCGGGGSVIISRALSSCSPT